MTLLKALYLAVGAALFAALLYAFDLGAALALLWQVGAAGVAALCLAFFVAFAADVVVWQLCLGALAPGATWFRRLLRVRLVGEAYNLVMPAGGFGGEPVKAILLKAHYGLGYADTSAGIVLARIVGMVGQCAFVVLAMLAMRIAVPLPPALEAGAWAGLAILIAMTACFVLLPRMRLSARLGRRLEGRRWARGLAAGLGHVEAIESVVRDFGRHHPARYGGALALSLFRWSAGALEMWLALHLLGFAITPAEAFVLEGILQMTRSASFFIPANLGTQDGAVALVAVALTGSPAAGLGAALLRRLREIVFVALGLMLGGWYSVRALRAAKLADLSPSTVEKER